MTMTKTKFLLLSSILKTRLDEVYPNTSTEGNTSTDWIP